MTRAPTTAKPVRHPAALLMQLRIWHSYIGMLIAPATIFLAATGLLQIYSLHEAHAGYTPPPLIEKLGKVHKDQVFALGHHKPPRASSASSDNPASDHRPEPTATRTITTTDPARRRFYSRRSSP